MSHSQKKEDPAELFKNLTEAGQKLSKTYFDNLPNLIHSGNDLTKAWLTFGSNANSKPKEGLKIQNAYLEFYKKQIELWQQINQHNRQGGSQPLPNGDKRFKSPGWNEPPYYFYFIKQTYLMAAELMNDIIEQSAIDDTTKKKLKFYSQLYIDALSPANFLATNPEALKQAQQTNGQSLTAGFKNLLHDIKQGRISQTDFSAFKVGKNLAATKGSVVFQNELIQLIQYHPKGDHPRGGKPLTKKVCQIPLLIIPPWINRY